MLHASACYGENRQPRYEYLTIRWAPHSASTVSDGRRGGPRSYEMVWALKEASCITE